MSFFKDALALADKKLHAVLSESKPDPAKARAPMLKGIDRTLSQYHDGKSKAPHRWWSVSNGVVEFAPKLGGNVVQINGEDRLYVPAERFPDFLAKMKSAVEAGEFDDELANHGKGDAAVSVPKVRKPRDPNKVKPDGGGSRAWTPERLAKFKETVRKRNEAKAAG